jgi:hypothetical protein
VFARRLLLLLIVVGLIGVPAGILRALCVGSACGETAAASRVPFCGLPAPVREAIERGYREGRSPDVLGVTSPHEVLTRAAGVWAPWPAVAGVDDRVPIAFAGAGVEPGSAVPPGATLDAIAPTLAEILGFDRPFPDVRSGVAVEGVASGELPRLVLVVAWKGVGTPELEAAPEAWPFLASLLERGAGTLEGRTGSLPLDPTAALATIGTGGTPSEHGVTGSIVRNDEGAVVPAFGEGGPVPVIATLAEDLDEATGQRATISLVATDELDRGLIGGRWYQDHDVDDVVVATGGAVVDATRTLLERGGPTRAPAILGVVLDGDLRSIDRRTARVVAAARAAAGGSVALAVAGTGSADRPRGTAADARLVAAVEDAVPGDAPAVAATVPGGLFLDRRALTEAEVTGQVAVDALLSLSGPDGGAAMADAFQGFAVSFSRFCATVDDAGSGDAGSG